MAKVIACPICGNPFVQIDERRHFCSDACSLVAYKRRKVDGNQDKILRNELKIQKQREKSEEYQRAVRTAKRDADYEKHVGSTDWFEVHWTNWEGRGCVMRGNTSMIRCALAELPLNRRHQMSFCR